MEIQIREDRLRFITAGNATFTLESSETKNRYTFRVVRTEKYFKVELLIGSNNETDYTYIGFINLDGMIKKHIPKGDEDTNTTSKAAYVFYWFYIRLITGKDVSKVNFYHAGKCARCGRKLTTPEAVERGIGNKCLNLL